MTAAEVPLYSYRARSYPWALRAIAAAEAVHGPPVPTCRCGAPLAEYDSRNPYGQCDACKPGAPVREDALHFTGPDGRGACHPAGAYESTDDPRQVTCRNCAATAAVTRELAARMVSS